MSRYRRLAVVLGINVALVVGQGIAGFLAHSSALLADGAHNLTDVCSIAVSLLAVRWALRPRSDARSYGNHRATILAALANSSVLALVTIAIMALSIERLIHPEHVAGATVAAVAGAGILANGLAALLLRDGSNDLNMRANLIHMAADVAASFAVLVAGLVVLSTSGGSWDRIDPAASLLVAMLIVIEAYRLVRSSVDVLLEATPRDLDLSALRLAITQIDKVAEVHDLHVWSISGEIRALSAHLVILGNPSLEEAHAVADEVRSQVSHPFGLAHTAFELEGERCVDERGDPCGIDDMATLTPTRSHGHAHSHDDANFSADTNPMPAETKSVI